MERYLFSLVIIALGLIIGKSLFWFEVKLRKRSRDSQPRYIVFIRNMALLGLNPLIVVSSFWVVSFDNVKLIVVPLLGFCAMALGGAVAVIASKVLKHDRKKTGAMFVSGSFTNLGTFGTLICFAFFGEVSLAFVYMYKLFEEVYYYMIGYPIAKTYGTSKDQKKSKLKSILTDPFILVYFFSIMLGCLLNYTGVNRPSFFTNLNSTLIPIISVLLVSTVGYNMRFSRIRSYLKECFIASGIKFIITPVFITLLVFLTGLHSLENGLIFKVSLVLSFMPTAFNSLIPPQIYGLDKDLANSVWLFTTGMLIIVLPILSFFI